MRSIILAAALTLAASTAFAQNVQYDRTGDHLNSFSPITPAPAPKHQRASRHAERAKPVSQTAWESNVANDRTGDHLNSFHPQQ